MNESEPAVRSVIFNKPSMEQTRSKKQSSTSSNNLLVSQLFMYSADTPPAFAIYPGEVVKHTPPPLIISDMQSSSVTPAEVSGQWHLAHALRLFVCLFIFVIVRIIIFSITLGLWVGLGLKLG